MAFKHKRVRVERGLYKAGDVYWACATRPHNRAAEWKRLGVIGIQQARRDRDEFAYELKSGKLTPVARPIKLHELADQWFGRLDELEAAGDLRPRTVSSYKGGITLHVLPRWGSREVASIDVDDLVRWHERQRASGAAAWTIRARWMAMRGLLGHATRERYLSANPCEALTRRERPKPGRAKTRYLSEDEIQRILEYSGSDARTINALLIFSGVRASELLGLVWEAIDFSAQVIHVRNQMSRQGDLSPLKSESGRRDVVMMDALARVLRQRRLAARFSAHDDFVIGNGVGRTLGYSRLRKAFAGTAARAKVDEVTPHTCRHTFASILIHQGASIEFVSDQLGHASTKTTWDIYVHLFRARDQAATAKRELDAAFGPMLRAVGEDSDDG